MTNGKPFLLSINTFVHQRVLDMIIKMIKLFIVCICCSTITQAQIKMTKKIAAQRFNGNIKIDGVLDEAEWKTAAIADSFVEFRPNPFKNETAGNATQVYLMYNNEGIYAGGYLHEQNKDSIAAELVGRDGFGNNDFLGIVFDTYVDKQNGFEYFITPLGEQFDAKVSPSDEDFGWNAVWQSAAKINSDGWSFEMFIPYSAIRFGKNNIQDWGLNIIRKRQKSGQQLFWQSLDPEVNGFLTQEGFFTGLENIKPPLRLQFSPYFSSYVNHDGTASAGAKKTTATVNGGMDVKYGLNQAFTLDMTLIPDFGQVQTDNRILNLTPFEQRFNENRAFFTEGTELFNKGNLFYSRRIGIDPVYKKRFNAAPGESITEDPGQAKIINATKISGRTQKGLGIGILNAVSQAQYTTFQNNTSGLKSRRESMPLTNYNVFVLNQSLKNNSSVSLVNTNVWRSGNAYDANVTSGLFDFNNKKNTWNVGGNISMSNIIDGAQKTKTGYGHNIYFGKTSGRFNFNIYQELYNDKYDKSDMGYFTNNNYMEEGLWAGYRWIKPKGWYNQMRINTNFWYNRLVTPIDLQKRKNLMYQNMGYNVNANAQSKKLWWIGMNFSINEKSNDFYEPRSFGRVFRNAGSKSLNLRFESNEAKKLSWSANINPSSGGVFHRKSMNIGSSVKLRFNTKLSVEFVADVTDVKNQPGWAAKLKSATAASPDTIIFSRRNLNSVENILGLKYNFTNKMGFTARVRHYWSKVNPVQFYELDNNGDLQTPASTFTRNVRQNYNFFSVDMVYNWQFAQGSFFSVVWKGIGEDFNRNFERNYIKNFDKTVNGKQYNSLSVRVIYFLDYLTAKKKWKTKSNV